MTYHSSSDVPVPYGRVVPGPSVEGEEGVRNYHGEKRRWVALLFLLYLFKIICKMQNAKKVRRVKGWRCSPPTAAESVGATTTSTSKGDWMNCKLAIYPDWSVFLNFMAQRYIFDVKH